MDNINEWKEFEAGKLFEKIYKAKAHVKSEMEMVSPFSENAIAFVTRTESNNGNDCFVLNSELSGIEKGNAIIIGDTTATCFYQEYEFVAGDHIVVCRAKWINRYTALFVRTLLEKERYRYSYGRAFKMDFIKNTVLRIPAQKDKNGNYVIDKHKKYSSDGFIPDWQKVEKYIEELVCQERNKGSIEKSVKTDKKTKKDDVDTSCWKDFPITKVFDRFVTGKAHSGMLEDGKDCIYLGAKKEDNCVMQMCAYNDELVHSGNCIIFICNGEGSVGYTNYMDREFIATTDLVIGYSKHLNCYTGVFLTTVLDLERPKYSFGRKWKTHLKDTVIKLPATEKGEPDWEYMENYIKSLPFGDRIY